MFVRPRTKEFLIGHPLLIVGIGMMSLFRVGVRSPGLEVEEPAQDKGQALTGWAALAMMIGSMGQTDIVNTLCHLHIPVMLSVARIGIGALLGCIIGTALWAIVLRLLPRAEA
jgi:hypothetical protein